MSDCEWNPSESRDAWKAMRILLQHRRPCSSAPTERIGCVRRAQRCRAFVDSRSA